MIIMRKLFVTRDERKKKEKKNQSINLSKIERECTYSLSLRPRASMMLTSCLIETSEKTIAKKKGEKKKKWTKRRE